MGRRTGVTDGCAESDDVAEFNPFDGCRLAAAAMAALVGMGVVDACTAAAQPELRASLSLG
ncbi:MAG: hypothetical protein LC721_07845, partial [Actinobacteria bacterium]|nr:hypothetical protein [Actinomycetota bacterium]